VLEIRAEQLVALRAPLHADLATRLVPHVRQHFPGPTLRLDDARLHALVLAGVVRCDGYGISIGRDVARFVNLMATLGWTFDVDLPWAQQVLRASGGRDRRPKLERLLEAANHRKPPHVPESR